MKNYSEFSVLLGTDLLAKNMSQRDLAEAISGRLNAQGKSLSMSTISSWKRPDRNGPSAKWIGKLIEVLGPESAIAKTYGKAKPQPPKESQKEAQDARPARKIAPVASASNQPKLQGLSAELVTLFELLPNDTVTRAKVYSQLASVIVNELEKKGATAQVA